MEDYLKDILLDISNELLKKKLTEQEKIDYIYPIISKQPEIINLNNTQNKYSFANIVYLSIQHCPGLFEKISKDSLFNIDYQAKTKEGFTLLHSAIQSSENINTFKLLYDKVANNEKFIEELKNQQSKSSYDKSYLLDFAISSQNIEAINFLNQRDFDINKISTELYSNYFYNFELFKTILDSGFDVNTDFGLDYNYNTETHIIDYLTPSDLTKPKSNITNHPSLYIEELSKHGLNFSLFDKFSKSEFISKYDDPNLYHEIKKYGFKFKEDNIEDFMILANTYWSNADSINRLKQFDVNLSVDIGGFNIFSFIYDHIHATSQYQGHNITEEIKMLEMLLKDGIKPSYNSYVADYNFLNKDTDDQRRKITFSDFIENREVCEQLPDMTQIARESSYFAFSDLCVNIPATESFQQQEDTYSKKDVLSLLDYYIHLFNSDYKYIEVKHYIPDYEIILCKIERLFSTKNVQLSHEEIINKRDEFLNVLVNNPEKLQIHYKYFIDNKNEINSEQLHSYLKNSEALTLNWFKECIDAHVTKNTSFKNDFLECNKKIMDTYPISDQQLLTIYDTLLQKYQKNIKQFRDYYKQNPIEQILIFKSELEKKILYNDLSGSIKAKPTTKRL